MAVRPGYVCPPGYKLTEVGVIPENWEVRLLPNVCRFRGGKAHEQHISELGRFVCVNSKFISTDGKVRKYSSQNFCCAKRDDIMMVMSDLPNGKALAKAFLADQDNMYAVNQRVCALTPYRDSSKYLFYVLNRNSYFLRFDDGVNQTHLLNRVFQKCPLPLPPTKAEQEAIARTLSDADALIESLEELLTKKRQIKQGAMQELLTGKKRLPGFRGEWEVRRLADESDLITKGTTPTSLGRHFTEQGINFVKVESLTEGGTVIPEMLAAVDEETHRLLKRSQLRENDILFSIAGALGRTTIVNTDLLPANTNQALAIIRLKPSSRLHHGFLLKYLSSPQILTHINAINVQAAQANLSLEDIRNFEVPAPSVDEQTAIAVILSDMDAEIAALEVKLATTRQLKQGMMQELLTGRIRLV